MRVRSGRVNPKGTRAGEHALQKSEACVRTGAVREQEPEGNDSARECENPKERGAAGVSPSDTSWAFCELC